MKDGRRASPAQLVNTCVRRLEWVPNTEDFHRAVGKVITMKLSRPSWKALAHVHSSHEVKPNEILVRITRDKQASLPTLPISRQSPSMRTTNYTVHYTVHEHRTHVPAPLETRLSKASQQISLPAKAYGALWGGGGKDV